MNEQKVFALEGLAAKRKDVSVYHGDCSQILMKDVLKLTTGSIVELNRNVGEPVEVLVNHSLIARGEVVVVEGNYGVRILHIASRQEIVADPRQVEAAAIRGGGEGERRDRRRLRVRDDEAHRAADDLRILD